MTKNDLISNLTIIQCYIDVGSYEDASKKLDHLIELVSTKDTVVPKNKALGTVDGKTQGDLFSGYTN